MGLPNPAISLLTIVQSRPPSPKRRRPETLDLLVFPAFVFRVGDGTRTHDIQIHSLTSAERSGHTESSTSGDAVPPLAPGLAPAGPDLLPRPPDPDLAAVAAAWDRIPEHVKAAILTLMATAR